MKIIFSCFTNLGWAQVTPTYNYVRLVGLFSIGNSLGCWSPHLLLLPIVPRVVQFYPTWKSPNYYYLKCIETGKENLYFEFRAKGV